MRFSVLVAAAMFAVMIPSARAASIIDQQNSASDGNSNAAGQSFTPTLTGIDFATFNLRSRGTASVVVRLFSGEGFGGSLLSTSSALSVSSVGSYTFLFPTTVSLTPETLYTFQLFDSTGIGFSPDTSISAPYARGQAFLASGAALGRSIDLTFSEGINATAVTPEPSSFLLLGTGVLGAMGAARRRLPA